MNQDTKKYQPYPYRMKSGAEARSSLPVKSAGDKEEAGFRNLFERAEPEASTGRFLYIHIPFCAHICDFCIYHKCSYSRPQAEGFLDQLIAHLNETAGFPRISSKPFDGVYLGGGTPTVLEDDDLDRIMNTVREVLPLSEGCEVSLESTLHNLGRERIVRLKEAGFNRVSLGVQSFDTRIRKQLGRISGREQAVRTLNLIAEAGFENICIDLVYLLKGQELSLWEQDLELVAELPVSGCSIYPLLTIPTHEPVLPDHPVDRQYAFFAAADERLTGLEGWVAHTPVQYGHREKGRAFYVSGHSTRAEILALGPSAAGRLSNYYYLNRPVQDAGSDPCGFFDAMARIFAIPPDYPDFQYLLDLLCHEGIPVDRAENEFEDYLDILTAREDQGLISCRQNSLVLTRAGRFWSANIINELGKRFSHLTSK